MEKLQELINACWRLIDQEKIDGDLMPPLDEAQQELYDLQKLCENMRLDHIIVTMTYNL